MYKLIIFDLDGTLLNTSYDIQRVLNDALSAFGYPQLSLQKTLEYVGNGAKKLIERAVPEGSNNALFDKIYNHYANSFAQCDNSLTCLYDGEEHFLNRLKAENIKTAIVTNKPQNATESVYAKLLSRFNFDCVLGQSPDMPLKPDAYSTLKIIEELKVDKCDCLFVGDGETDVQTAANAGVDCVSVLWGYRTKAQLEAAGAKRFAQSYSRLEDLVFNK